MNIKTKDLKSHICCIYKLNYPNGKCYIGLTNDLQRRMYEHNNIKRLDTHSFKAPCDLAIKKYGKIEEVEILEFFNNENRELMGDREKYWISFYHSNEKDKGYNLTEGGEKGLTGEKNSIAVFTNTQVYDIRKRRFFGERKRDVYQDYKDFNFGTFEHVWLGRGYPEVGKEYLIPTNEKSRQEYSSIANSGERNNKAKLTVDAVLKIRERYDSGEKYQEIAKDYPEVTKNTIRRVCFRETWKNI